MVHTRVMPLSVAIYTRLSQDADGMQTATSRQQKACESFAQLRDWQVVRVYEDVDLSAYAPGVKRPAYDEMLEAVRAKRVDGIIAWKLDRFVRRSADFERLWEICEKSDAFIASAMEPIDTSTDLGLALVRVIVAFASLESATLGVRLRAKMRERAELGVPHSGAAAYGLRRGWKELEPTEVERIREAIKRTLAGESLRSIILDWNRRGIPTHTKTSAGWSDASLRRILVSPRLAGLRQHQGVIIGPGNWPAIIDEETHERLKERLLPSSERAPRVKHQPTLLAGLLRCGICGLSLSHVVEYRSGTDMFICPPPPRGCSRISVRTKHITDAVIAELFNRLKDKGIGGRPSGNWDGLHDTAVSQALDTYNDALKDLAKDYYVEKVIGRSQFLDARDALYLEMELGLDARMPRPRAFKGVQNLEQLRRRWQTLTLDEQREIVRSELAHATVHRASRRGHYYDPSRLAVTWHDDLVASQRAVEWLTSAETMQRLGIGRTALRKRVQDGHLLPEPIGRAWMFRRREVEQIRNDAESAARRAAPPARKKERK